MKPLLKDLEAERLRITRLNPQTVSMIVGMSRARLELVCEDLYWMLVHNGARTNPAWLVYAAVNEELGFRLACEERGWV